jgi:hypothetical protein
VKGKEKLKVEAKVEGLKGIDEKIDMVWYLIPWLWAPTTY